MKLENTPYKNIKEFQNNKEYSDILHFIKNKIQYFENYNTQKYPNFDQKHFNYGNNLKEYQNNYNIPFFDVPIDSTMIKDDKTYISLDTFYIQMNIFFKSLFLRMFYSNYKIKDKFTLYVYENYKKYQKDNEFDIFEKNALDIYLNSNSVFDFTKNFIYNNDILFFNNQDIFDALDKYIGVLFPEDQDKLDIGLLLIADDFHNLPKYVEDHHDEITNGKNNMFSNIYFYKKIFPTLKENKTKFDFIPIADENPEKIFDASFTFHRINDKFYFIPQLLLFYTGY